MSRIRIMAAPIAALIAALLTGGVQGAPVYQPPGANLTYGDVTHGQRILSAAGNPAAAAAELARAGKEAKSGSHMSVVVGLEYGNVQELFDTFDELSKIFLPTEPDGDPPPPGQDPDDKPPGIDFPIDVDALLDQLEPEMQAAIAAVAKEAATLGALLALIKVEGYGKLFVSGDVPIVIGKEFLGGAWTFGVNYSGTSKAFGVAEAIDFDSDEALQNLRDGLSDGPSTLERRQIDLSGGFGLFLDPENDSALLNLENDSLLLTKAATIAEFAIGYSRRAWATPRGSLFLGGKLKYYRMQLSRISVRFGDITDSSELFDAIRHADFDNDNDFSFDLGALWVSDHYSLGATWMNVNEVKFRFPEVDTSDYKNPDIIAGLNADRTYQLEHQLKLEGSLYSQNRRWTANVGLDANAVPDPMGDDFQWLTLSAGYATDSWWLPGARVGLRRNLAGTEMTYLGLGVTTLKIVNIDIAATFDTVDISGKSLPQGLILSIGFEIGF